MKRKISVRLSEEVVERLEKAAAQRPGASKTTIVESALDRFLNPSAETIDDAALLRRLDDMSRQLNQIERDLKIVKETAALHARYHLAVTPPVARPDQRAACVQGLERFEEFAAQVERRVHLGVPLIRETLDRRGAKSLTAECPYSPSRETEENTPLSAAPGGCDQDIAASTFVNSEETIHAAAREGGSNGGFPDNEQNSPG